VDVEDVLKRFEGEGVLLEPVDAEERGLGSEPDEQIVVFDRRVVGQRDDPFVGVDRLDPALNEPRRGRFDLVDIERDLVLYVRIPDTAVGLVKHEVVVDVRDPGDVRLAVEFRFE